MYCIKHMGQPCTNPVSDWHDGALEEYLDTLPLATIIEIDHRPFGWLDFDKEYSKSAFPDIVSFFEDIKYKLGGEAGDIYIDRWDQFCFSSKHLQGILFGESYVFKTSLLEKMEILAKLNETNNHSISKSPK